MPRLCDRAPPVFAIHTYVDRAAGSKRQEQPEQDGSEPAYHCGQYRTPAIHRGGFCGTLVLEDKWI
jgi:hypothetical protein